jgi:LysR family hydrogen peroxide-inducible transcriptional activator
VGLFPTLGPYLLPHVVPNARERFPKLEMLLVEEKTEEILRRLRDGRLDVGILALPVHDERLRRELLFEEDFLLAVPKGHPLAALDRPATSSSIAGESLLLLEEGHCLREQALDVCATTGATERSGFKATSLETLRQMVSAGVGITLLPELAVQPPVPVSDDIELIRFAEPVPRRRIAMFWRPTNPYDDFMPRLAELFRDLPAGLVHASAEVPAPALAHTPA